MLGVYVAYTVAARTSSLLAGTLIAVLVVARDRFPDAASLPPPFRLSAARADDDDDGVRAVLPGRGADDLGRRPVHVDDAGMADAARWRPARSSSPGIACSSSRVAALVGVGLWIINDRTLIGARVRATVDDPEIAAATGINVALALGWRVRGRRRARGVRRRDGRADSGRLPRDGFRPAAARLRRRDHRRHGQPQGRADRRHRRRHDRQLRQGARARSSRTSRCSRRWC